MNLKLKALRGWFWARQTKPGGCADMGYPRLVSGSNSVVAAQLFCLCAFCVSSQLITDSLPYNSVTYTPLSSPEECARQCQDHEPPKTCYYHFTPEAYVTLGDACVGSDTNAQCVPADGVERSFLSVNRMLPGPSIQVCEGDKVVVDVLNKIPGVEVTLHWHGILQRETQYYDGVPFVTQCPIPEGTTFRYQWYANPGTHYWHSHSGLHKLDGLHGSLIVRQAHSRDPGSSLYDVDSPEHVIHLSDWLHELAAARFPGRYTNGTGGVTNQNPDNLFINGRGRYTDPVTGTSTNSSYAVFSVRPGVKFRFRVVAALATVCPVQLSVERHPLLILATDGEPVQPVAVDAVVLFSGERYDFVLSANQSRDSYWIEARGLGECQPGRVKQLAVLRYEGASETPSSPQPSYEDGLSRGVILNPLVASCDGSDPDHICVSQLINAREVNKGIIQQESDVKIFIPYEFFFYTQAGLFKSQAYSTFLVNYQYLVASKLDGISFASPPSPLLSQPEDVPPGQVCSRDDRPARCRDPSQPCACTHVLDVPYDSVVDVVIVDRGPVPRLSHPFHLHGHSFHVLGTGSFRSTNVTMADVQAVLDTDRRGLLRRQRDRPPGKDTVAVPNNGYAILRFRADNPGYWFFHCHFVYHIAVGMGLVVHVGEAWRVPPVPPRFPRCGNHLPPITAPHAERS